MKNLFLIILVLFLIPSCKDEVNSPDDLDGNLIMNPSFEENGISTLKGWESAGNINFFTDTPPGGGIFSIGLSESNGPPGYVSYSLRVAPGKKIFTFSCWAKTTNLPGEINVSITGDTVSHSTSIGVTDSIWTSYTISDTVDFIQDDTLRIFLKGSISQLIPSVTYYDNTFLEIKD
jgi:hypothetical protein